MTRIDRIRTLNDELRTKFKGGKIAATPGVLALGDLQAILRQLREFSDFSPENDPYHEHDFGTFRYDGKKHIAGVGPLLYFKVDYYDNSLLFGSPDPAEPALTSRVLTLMLAEEY